jgi:hypothetical protein
MKDFGKWIYRILIVLLVVMAIDFNSNWLKSPAPQSSRFIIADLIIGGLLILLLIVPKIKRRL